MTKNYKLDKEEKELLKALDKKWPKSVPNVKEEMEKARQAARNTLLRNKNINIRISEWDLHKLRTRAVEKGLPYQTLIASILHQYNG
ncbi:MAG TPA: antitoxin [Candidatus Paceibacterota bacterium]